MLGIFLPERSNLKIQIWLCFLGEGEGGGGVGGGGGGVVYLFSVRLSNILRKQ